MPMVLDRPRLNEDVIPLSQFRSGLTDCIIKTRRTHRPIVITQNGTSSSVLIDVGDYEALMETIEIVQDVRKAEAQIERGEVLTHADFVASLKAEGRL